MKESPKPSDWTPHVKHTGAEFQAGYSMRLLSGPRGQKASQTQGWWTSRHTYRGVGDGQDPVLDGALPSLPHFPDPEDGAKHDPIQHPLHAAVRCHAWPSSQKPPTKPHTSPPNPIQAHQTPHKPGSGLPFITPGGGEHRLAGTQGGTRALVSSRSGRTSRHVELPWAGTEPVSPAVEAQSLNHWAAREAHSTVVDSENGRQQQKSDSRRIDKWLQSHSYYRVSCRHLKRITQLQYVWTYADFWSTLLVEKASCFKILWVSSRIVKISDLQNSILHFLYIYV